VSFEISREWSGKEHSKDGGRRKQSSGMWHRIEGVLTDVSEERIASIFRVEGKIRKSGREAFVRDVKSRPLKLEAIRSSETSVNAPSTRCHIPEDCFLHSHRRENLKSYMEEEVGKLRSGISNK
jgi:hypothetical protein